MQPESAAKYHETPIRVRFSEVDSYGIAWHGHYVAWMEEGRNDLAGRFGMDPAQIAAVGYQAPVVSLELKYLRPARFGDELVVRTSAVRSDTATLEFRCVIVGEDGKKLASGRSVHALTDRFGVLQYTLPEPIGERLAALLDHMGT